MIGDTTQHPGQIVPDAAYGTPGRARSSTCRGVCLFAYAWRIWAWLAVTRTTLRHRPCVAPRDAAGHSGVTGRAAGGVWSACGQLLGSGPGIDQAVARAGAWPAGCGQFLGAGPGIDQAVAPAAGWPAGRGERQQTT